MVGRYCYRTDHLLLTVCHRMEHVLTMLPILAALGNFWAVPEITTQRSDEHRTSLPAQISRFLR